MKFNKIFLPVVAVASLFVAACTEDVKYTPAEPSPVTKYYFPTSNTDTKDLVDGTTYFTVTVGRAEAGAEETVQINSSTDGKFTIPESVTFEEGAGLANLRVAYNLAEIEVNTHYNVTVELPGIQDTPYSYGKLSMDVIYLPWKNFEEDESMGWYREGFIYGMFNGVALEEYKVPMQMHPTTPGIYRLVNPYNQDDFPYNFGDFLEGDCYMVINCTDPEKVLIPRFNLGPIYDDAPLIGISLNAAVKEPDPASYGTLKDGVITFPAKALLIGIIGDDGNTYDLYYANSDETFRVVLPGYEKPTEWAQYGMCEFTDGFYGKYLLGDSYQPTPYKVLVENHMQETGMYRIVNPYAVYGEEVAAQGGEYFNIDATKPKCVFWTYETGKTVGMGTQVLCGTYADFMYDNEKADYDKIVASEVGGKLQNNVLTVPGEYAGTYTVSRRGTFTASGIEAKLDLNNPEPVESEEQTRAARAAKIAELKSRLIPTGLTIAK